MTIRPIPTGKATQVGVDFLTLPRWRTIAVEETEFTYLVEAEPLSEPAACPKCGGPAAALRPCGTVQESRRDAPARGKHVIMNFARRCYQCGACGRTSRQPLAGVHQRRKATIRLVELVGVEAFSKTHSQVSRETGAGLDMIRSVFVEKATMFDQTVRPEAPCILGVDEAYVRGRRHYVLTDLEARQPLEILSDRGVLTLCHYLLRLPRRGEVEAVVINLCRSDYEVVRRVIPQAAIVINKWAVWQQARRTLIKVVQKERAVLPAETRFKLTRAMRCLNKSHSRLTRDEHILLEELFRCVPELGQAYRLRRGFFGLWNFRNRQEVEARYDQWAASVPPYLYYAFGDLLRMVEHWRQEIFNYFEHQATNAYTESVIRKLSEAQQISPTCSFETIGPGCSTKDS